MIEASETAQTGQRKMGAYKSCLTQFLHTLEQNATLVGLTSSPAILTQLLSRSKQSIKQLTM